MFLQHLQQKGIFSGAYFGSTCEVFARQRLVLALRHPLCQIIVKDIAKVNKTLNIQRCIAR